MNKLKPSFHAESISLLDNNNLGLLLITIKKISLLRERNSLIFLYYVTQVLLLRDLKSRGGRSQKTTFSGLDNVNSVSFFKYMLRMSKLLIIQKNLREFS